MPVDPNDPLDAFLQGVSEMEARYSDTYKAVADHVGAPRGLQLRKGLAADFAFRLGSEWELFQHKWHVVAITAKPSTFVTRSQLEIDKAVDKVNLGPALAVIHGGKLQIPTKPKQAEVEQLLDPRGFNVTFDSGETWVAEAVKDLDSTYARKVKDIVAKPEDACVLDLVKAIRNHLAHGSGGSLSRVNDLVRERQPGDKFGLVGTANAPLKRDTNRLHDASVYLHGRGPNTTKQRVQHLAKRIGEVAEQLRV